MSACHRLLKKMTKCLHVAVGTPYDVVSSIIC